VVQSVCRRIPLTKDVSVSTPESNQADIQRRYREFLDLLPLTLSLAGLPPSDVGKYFSEEQIEGRSFTIKHAFKLARVLTRELVSR
jgi:hypothetical protein